MASQVKTNAVRLLENAGIKFTAFEYDVSDGEIDGLSIARKLNVESDQVFKAKYEYALDNGIGIMCWSMPEDATDTYINSIYYVKNK